MKIDFTRKKPIRILCVFATLDIGGAETMCINLLNSLNKEKVVFDFVKHTNKDCAYENEIIKLGGNIYEAPKYKIYNHFSYCSWWNKFLKEHVEYEIIHGHFTNLAGIYLRIAKKNKRITIIHSHALNRFDLNATSILRRIYAYHAPKYADYCFSCSDDAGKWLYKSRPYIILKNAVDTKLFDYSKDKSKRIKKELGLENNFVIGVVGSIKEVKNPIGIVEIFKSTYLKINNARLLWVGDGNMKNEIEKLLNKDQLLSKTIFTGVVNDVYNFMQAMDVLIMPSFSEGLPVSLIEAQCCGLPCVVSKNIPKESKIIKEFLFADINNIDEWVNAIISFYNYNRISQKDTVAKKGYDINITAFQMERFYMELYKNRSNK